MILVSMSPYEKSLEAYLIILVSMSPYEKSLQTYLMILISIKVPIKKS